MKTMKFYRTNSITGVYVNSKQDIIAYFGELGYSFDSIDSLDTGLVIGYIRGQGVTLGQLKEECV